MTLHVKYSPFAVIYSLLALVLVGIAFYFGMSRGYKTTATIHKKFCITTTEVSACVKRYFTNQGVGGASVVCYPVSGEFRPTYHCDLNVGGGAACADATAVKDDTGYPAVVSVAESAC